MQSESTTCINQAWVIKNHTPLKKCHWRKQSKNSYAPRYSLCLKRIEKQEIWGKLFEKLRF